MVFPEKEDKSDLGYSNLINIYIFTMQLGRENSILSQDVDLHFIKNFYKITTKQFSKEQLIT